MSSNVIMARENGAAKFAACADAVTDGACTALIAATTLERFGVPARYTAPLAFVVGAGASTAQKVLTGSFSESDPGNMFKSTMRKLLLAATVVVVDQAASGNIRNVDFSEAGRLGAKVVLGSGLANIAIGKLPLLQDSKRASEQQ